MNTNNIDDWDRDTDSTSWIYDSYHGVYKIRMTDGTLIYSEPTPLEIDANDMEFIE